MLCQRCFRGLNTVIKPMSPWCRVQQVAVQPSLKRKFTAFRGPSRPTSLRPSVATQPFFVLSKFPVSSTSGEVLDLLPKISTHPSAAATQFRCGPRRTFDPSHFVRKRRHGFLSRIRTRKGRALLKRRKAKGRTTLSH
ncbi:hypothetical protein BUE80_DR004044 [Diplocarpon rosae]|nr:hypothetical protein BUE80_DR004044 [Diplocarpon rosae]